MEQSSQERRFVASMGNAWPSAIGMSTAVCPLRISSTFVTELRPTSVTSVTSATSATCMTSATCVTCVTSATSVTSVPAAAFADQTEGDHRHHGRIYELLIASVNQVCTKVQGFTRSVMIQYEFNWFYVPFALGVEFIRIQANGHFETVQWAGWP